MGITTNSVDAGLGLELLMQALYARYCAGLPRLADNVFMVNFEPLNDDERRRMSIDNVRKSQNNPTMSDFEAGVWVAAEKLGGW